VEWLERTLGTAATPIPAMAAAMRARLELEPSYGPLDSVHR
jgi:hypothetical protein